jgi:threonine aldolase
MLRKNGVPQKETMRVKEKCSPVDSLLFATNRVLKSVMEMQKRAGDLQSVYSSVARQWR